MEPQHTDAAPSPKNRPSTGFIVALSALATLAIVHALLVQPKAHRDPFFDELRFRVYAQNLTAHHFYGDKAGTFPATVEMRSVGYKAGVAPGYPFFLAAFRAFGNSTKPVRAAQWALAGLTVAMVGLIGRRLFGEIAGLLAAALLIATAVLAAYTQFTLSEVLSAATLTGAVLLAIIACDRKSWRVAAAAGFVLGISALVRPQVLALPLLLAPWAFFAWGKGRTGVRAGAALLAGFVLALAPWTIRNAFELHAFVPGSSYTWANFWLANNPGADGLFRRPEAYIGEARVRQIRSLPELAQDAEWRRMALTWVREHPGDAVRGWLRNGWVFVSHEDRVITKWYAIRGGTSVRLDERFLLPAAAAAALLLAAMKRFLRATWVPVIVVVYSIVFFCFFLPEPRYRVSMVPMVAVLAGAVLPLLWRLARRATHARAWAGA